MRLELGDCLEKLKELPDNSIDSVVTDPPYGIGFMNKEWDSPQKHMELIEREQKRSEERFNEGKSPVKVGFSKGVQPGLKIGGAKEGKWFQEWCELWGRECLRVLKPGGYLVSFSAPRTYHRMTTGLEDAGFEIRDQIMWVFGSGFPKSHNIGKAVDKLQGNERTVVGMKRSGMGKEGPFGNPTEAEKHIPNTKGTSEWEGWGTALKPAHEPIVLARKPLSEKTNAENVLRWGTGGLNIDESRIEYKDDKPHSMSNERSNEDSIWKTDSGFYNRTEDWVANNTGRWPANIIFDEEAGQVLDQQSGISKSTPDKRTTKTPTGEMFGTGKITSHNDKGGASRFFYCPKASKKDRDEGMDLHDDKILNRTNSGGLENTKDWGPVVRKNNHPTVKPTELMLYLIKLVTPKGGTVLEPFMGSGSTGKAAVRGGYDFIGIEKEEEYLNIAKARIENELK
jgi:site-specific DNA-methyltransferase (adenine-specific)